MNRNLPISSRISVDVQQLFDDLIVVKCNVNNKEFQGILLNTSKSFFGINESRLKSGPEGLSVKEADKSNVSFSCSVERYSYKLDGTGPSIFTRHPVKRHKSPPASGKHVICQKCQSVVTIPDQVEKQVNNYGSDDSSDVSGVRTCSRRKSQTAPKRISNFDTRENFENNHFTNYRSNEVKEKAVADSPIVGIGSNITKITPSSSLLDVKKILKKKKKKERLKEKPKEPELEPKPSAVKEEVKERAKKRKLEAQSERAPVKKCKLLEIPHQPQPTQDSAEKSGKASKHGKDSSRVSKGGDAARPSVEKNVVSSTKAKHPGRDEGANPVKSRTEERSGVKDGEKPVKKIKWDNLLEKKLKKKRKADKFSLPVKSDVESSSRSALSSVIGAANGEAGARRVKSDAKSRPASKPTDDTPSAVADDGRVEEEKAEKEEPPADAGKEAEPEKTEKSERVEKSAVATLQKLMRSHLVESESERKRGSDECEVTSLLPETTSHAGPAVDSPAPKRRPASEAPPDSSLSLKIKINRTPSSDNGGYQCRIVGEEVSSSTADLPPPPESPSDAGPSTPSAASSEPPPAEVAAAAAEEPGSAAVVEERLVERCTMHRGEVFAVGDVVWAKITGYPWWPARINVIRQSERVEAQERVVSHTAEVLWFNWDQISYISCEKLFHFLDHYKVKCDKKRKGTYRNAVEQAWMAAQAAQSIAEDEEEEEEFARCLTRSSSNSTPSQVSSSSTPVLRHAPSSSSNALPEAPATVVSSTGVKEGVGTANAASPPPSCPNPAHSHEPRRRESSDDDSDSGLVIDTELASLGSV